MRRFRASLTWAVLALGTAPESAACGGTAPSGEARDADGLTCSSSVDDRCEHVACFRTRAAAVDAASSPAPSYCPAVSIAACGAYDVLAWNNVDTSEWDYYDATTGDLVAVVTQGPFGDASCVAGPADFVQPTCASPTVFPCASADAGTEAPLDGMDAGGDATYRLPCSWIGRKVRLPCALPSLRSRWASRGRRRARRCAAPWMPNRRSGCGTMRHPLDDVSRQITLLGESAGQTPSMPSLRSLHDADAERRLHDVAHSPGRRGARRLPR